MGVAQRWSGWVEWEWCILSCSIRAKGDGVEIALDIVDR